MAIKTAITKEGLVAAGYGANGPRDWEFVKFSKRNRDVDVQSISVCLYINGRIYVKMVLSRKRILEPKADCMEDLASLEKMFLQ